jgi:drug/metabolite transporter (DMT)-like permease
MPGIRAGILVIAACVGWGLDNHWTALIDGLGPAETTAWKGIVAGATNLALGLAIEPWRATGSATLAALSVGALSYGASIVLHVIGSQHLGATRAQVVFSSAPFIGAALSFVLLGEPLGARYAVAASGLALGVGFLFLDRHAHAHTHPAIEHVHSHRHDEGHHDHFHPGLPPSTRHTHVHRHEERTHAHRHLPDLHHRHVHRDPPGP